MSEVFAASVEACCGGWRVKAGLCAGGANRTGVRECNRTGVGR